MPDAEAFLFLGTIAVLGLLLAVLAVRWIKDEND